MLEVGPLSAIPPGEGVRVDAAPPIAVFHTDDGHRAGETGPAGRTRRTETSQTGTHDE